MINISIGHFWSHHVSCCSCHILVTENLHRFCFYLRHCKICHNSCKPCLGISCGDCRFAGGGCCRNRHLGHGIVKRHDAVVAGIGAERTGGDVIDGLRLVGVPVLSNIRGMEVTGEDGGDASIGQAVAHGGRISNRDRFYESITTSDMRYQRVVHHGDDLLAGSTCGSSLGTHPVERSVRQRTARTRIDADDHQVRDRLAGVGQCCTLSLRG